jgi:hypothetical protein
MKKYHLPQYQYTAREVVSGLQFIAYAQECSLTYANLFAEITIGHLKKCQIDLIPPLAGQTDNGSEFIGAWSAKGLVHDTIPPGAHTYLKTQNSCQADQETPQSGG